MLHHSTRFARALAEHFHIARSCVRLLAGFSAKEKVFDVAIEHSS